MKHPIIEQQIKQIQSRYPQAFAEQNKSGAHLIVVPGFKLTGYTHDICTVLFVAPPGFPGACPTDFWIDITDVNLTPPKQVYYHHSDGEYVGTYWKPKCTNESNPIPGFPNWKNLTWFSWHLQAWNPNKSSLYTYLKVIEQRLNPAR